MAHLQITTAAELTQFCSELRDAEAIAFDTEFVSEHTYRSELCLVQVAAQGRLAVIDPLAIGDLAPFWQTVVADGHETIVHAGREELVFCLDATGRRPARLFDVQLAAGLVGYEYPAGYGSLLARLVGQQLHKGETRTDWRRRPLSRQQIDYALDDVRHLEAMRDKLYARLQQLGRLKWLEAEMQTWQDDVDAYRTRERWRRVSGIAGLSNRSLAIVRALWRWREDEAERRDLPPRRVLRDDLIIELAKRRSADIKQISAVRGLDRGDLQRILPKLGEAIDSALNLPESDLPRTERRETPNQINMLGQFLSSALTSICRTAEIAPSLVGTASDVRDLVAYRLGFDVGGTPILAEGWRAEVVGHLIEDLLAGKTSIRIANPLSDEPLVFEPRGRD
ncbi:MAG: HRDC domain-containing protein [Pirellulales bacterium]